MTEFSFFFWVNYPWACDSSVISKLTHILVVDPWCVTLTTSTHTFLDLTVWNVASHSLLSNGVQRRLTANQVLAQYECFHSFVPVRMLALYSQVKWIL